MNIKFLDDRYGNIYETHMEVMPGLLHEKHRPYQPKKSLPQMGKGGYFTRQPNNSPQMTKMFVSPKRDLFRRKLAIVGPYVAWQHHQRSAAALPHLMRSAVGNWHFSIRNVHDCLHVRLPSGRAVNAASGVQSEMCDSRPTHC